LETWTWRSDPSGIVSARSFKEQVIKEVPGITRKKFLYNLSRSSYEKEWGTQYQKPGFRVRLVSWVLRVIPKVGPFKSLAFLPPTPEVEKMFMASFNATVDNYRTLLGEVNAGRLVLANDNFDIGEPVAAGKYLGADQAYDHLLGKLADRKFAGVSPELRGNVVEYYKSRQAPASKKDGAGWAKLQGQLDELQSAPAAPPSEVP
jgi:hypothetical protein